ncbi:MAG: 30S ribosomal protein S19 [Omnitrophica bacterium]|nr:30S ribosomal protein S19 [Candidatus Omnitrophota bacterium]
MGRSLKKGPYIDEKLLEKIKKTSRLGGEKKPIKSLSRRSKISPEFVGFTFLIHNGRKFTPAFITEDMVGHKLGEFAPTRIFRKHGGVTKVSLEKT